MAAKIVKEGEQQPQQQQETQNAATVEEKDTNAQIPEADKNDLPVDEETAKKSEEIIDMPTEKVIEEEKEVKPKFGLKRFFTKSKPKATQPEDEKEIKTTNDEKEDQCQARTHFGRRLLNAITGFAKKPQDDVEVGQDKTEIVVEEKPMLDEVDRAVINVNETEEIISSTNDELKKSTSSGELEKYASAADKQTEAEGAPKKTFYNRLHSYKCYLPMIGVTLGLLLSIYVILGCGSEDEFPRAIPLRDGRYILAVTSCGLVEGERIDNAYLFKGIPFGTPPTDDRRWRSSGIVLDIDDCWNGTFPAHNEAPRCSQMLSNGTIVGQEDCLSLDIITPFVHYYDPKPVVVLIDAASLTGPSPDTLLPSMTLAAEKQVVFVRPNFRLGPFGFLSLVELTKDTYPPVSGNGGLSDILTALRWIQLNIHHFGGDPKSVTILGHRAGATLVSALVASPLFPSFLYSRAWISSAAAVLPGKPLQESQKANLEFQRALNCQSSECLRAASTEQIWAATPDTWLHFPADLPTKEESTSSRHEWLVLDGYILNQHPSESWKQERTGNPILVMGTTAHESHTTKLRERHSNWTAEEVRAYLDASQIGALNLTDEVIQLYNATNYRSLVSIITDIRTICPLLINARLQPTVPFYVVTQGEGDDQLANVDADVQAILGLYKPQKEEQRRFVSTTQELFYNYVANGTMPQYDPRRRVLNVGQDVVSQEDYNNCNYWISKDIVPRFARLD